jgi:hypothetical protein
MDSAVRIEKGLGNGGGWFVVYAENFSHCYSCRGRLAAHFLSFVAGVATFIDRNPQRVITVEFDTEPECDAETTARAFHRYGYFSDDRPWGQ